MSSNAWLRSQRKSNLTELAAELNIEDYDGLRKNELEALIENYILTHESALLSNTHLTNFWNSRARSTGSPIKRESLPASAELAVKTPTTALRRRTRALDEIALTEEASSPSIAVGSRTPARVLALAHSKLALPVTPASVQKVVDRSVEIFNDSVVAVQDSQAANATVYTRSVLSTVFSIIFSVFAFEAYFLRPAVLPDTLWFTVPAVPSIKLPDVPIILPNLKIILSCSFWGPTLTWLVATVFAPLFIAYFYNLSANASSKRQRAKYTFDPLSFSIAKAIFSYVVFSQGVTFNVIKNPAVDRVNAAVYGGWQGLLVGAGVTGLAAFYEAILSK